MTKLNRKYFLLFYLMISCFLGANAQNWELGISTGGTDYFGDVNNELHFQNMRYYFSGFVRKHLGQKVVARVNVGYVRIAGLDSISTSEFQRNRNLNFYADMFEFSGQLEFNFVKDKTRGRRIKNYTIPYVFAGLGVNYFTPKTIYADQSYNLAALKTSGISYSQVALIVPIGFGVRYYLTSHWQIGFEFGTRFTSTSDLDDIRGTSVYPDPVNLPNATSRLLYDRSTQPKAVDTGYGFGVPGSKRGLMGTSNDIYMTFGVNFSYKFGLLSSNRFHGKIIHCPRFY